ncbi:hypothetical protein CYY_008626 [Polysphondylium violaceum]|uniref:Uncharacterized protein n=1 Tax=Polysphondylium violaceum TaxID=133409 RepID=A0A8J4PN71_9MYCE|nr:hypothetical protein CYY_008626 [Polysphondylium violaceum]
MVPTNKYNDQQLLTQYQNANSFVENNNITSTVLIKKIIRFYIDSFVGMLYQRDRVYFKNNARVENRKDKIVADFLSIYKIIGHLSLVSKLWKKSIESMYLPTISLREKHIDKCSELINRGFKFTSIVRGLEWKFENINTSSLNIILNYLINNNYNQTFQQTNNDNLSPIITDLIMDNTFSFKNNFRDLSTIQKFLGALNPFLKKLVIHNINEKTQACCNNLPCFLKSLPMVKELEISGNLKAYINDFQNFSVLEITIDQDIPSESLDTLLQGCVRLEKLTLKLNQSRDNYFSLNSLIDHRTLSSLKVYQLRNIDLNDLVYYLNENKVLVELSLVQCVKNIGQQHDPNAFIDNTTLAKFCCFIDTLNVFSILAKDILPLWRNTSGIKDLALDNYVDPSYFAQHTQIEVLRLESMDMYEYERESYQVIFPFINKLKSLTMCLSQGQKDRWKQLILNENLLKTYAPNLSNVCFYFRPTEEAIWKWNNVSHIPKQIKDFKMANGPPIQASKLLSILTNSNLSNLILHLDIKFDIKMNLLTNFILYQSNLNSFFIDPLDPNNVLSFYKLLQ